MLNENDFFLKSKTYNYFEKNLLKNKNIRDTLISLEELLNIKKNIKNIYNTDDPEEIKKNIGQTINNLTITDKDYEYAKLIDEKYKSIYEKSKTILNQINKQ